MKSGRMRWAGHVHAWDRKENCTTFWLESPKESDLLEDRDLDGRMKSECILRIFAGRILSGFNWLRTVSVAGCCECGDETSARGATQLVIFIFLYIILSSFYHLPKIMKKQ
jgi:hypothetical protein